MRARETAIAIRLPMPAGLLLAGLLVPAAASLAQSMGPAQMTLAPAATSLPAPAARSLPGPRLPLAEVLGAAPPLADLPPASVGAADRLAALAAWNAAGRLPVMAGFPRNLPAPVAVRFTAFSGGGAEPRPFAGGLLARSEAGGLAWGVHVRVQDAHRLRLHLADVHLPAGTRMWVAAKGREPRGFGLELLSPAGDLWTPSVKGESLLFEVQVPAGSAEARFTIGEVMELVDLDPRKAAIAGTVARSTPGGSAACLVDSSCVGDSVLPQIGLYRHAMAQLGFIEYGGAYLCSGSLLNDVAGDFIPYLLTAHHCFSDQYAASSLEATFDYYTASCNGPPPAESTEPMANGSTLLATGSASDFTFVKLDNLPAGRTFLGWNASAGALQQGTAVYRLSFPVFYGPPNPESFSQGFIQTGSTVGVCAGVPRPNFLYQTLTQGATFPGSSGSPLLLGNGQVVGQLYGACGPDPANGCDYANSDVDGAFAVTFPWVAAWLNPSNTCYALSLGHSGPGSDPVASPLGSGGCPNGTFTAGTPIQLTASPAAGSVLTGWSGTLDDGSTASTNALTMPAMDYSVSVHYQACYALSVGHTGSGSDPATVPASSPGCSTGSYYSGATLYLRASPAPGWIVAGWTGTTSDQSLATANYAVMPSSNHAVSVAYQQKGFYTLPPCRLIDTRGPAGPLGGPALQPSADRFFQLAGVCGVPATAQALSVNVTVTQPTAPGFLELFSSDLIFAPQTSNINFVAGQTRANNAILGVYDGGIEVQNSTVGTVQLILDVNGYFQ
ncbi:MAG TPA: trypsin-like peptidase domain-containing protein [Thermoanaerobaculia bacterium]|jgi:hypothetical protein|nr:trypsin-like peptidase domain-containing protein [Thermoanaerobaculia bacterium]